MFSAEFSYLFDAAYREAQNRKHQYFCVEHLLFSLLFDLRVITLLEYLDVEVTALQADLEEFFDKYVETVDLDQLNLNDTLKNPEDVMPVQTNAVKEVLESALIQAKVAEQESVSSEAVLVQILMATDSHASYYLHQRGVDKINLIQAITNGVSSLPLIDNSDKQLVLREQLRDQLSGEGSTDEDAQQEDSNVDADHSKRKFLKKYAENLTKQAANNQLDPVFGREKELNQLIKILCRRGKNNPILIGEPGVGKTVMANALATAIVANKVPEQLKDAELFVLQIGQLIAGTKFRGEFENRLNGIIKDLRTLKQPVVFIDEIHTIVGAGSTGDGNLDAANLLKPVLSGGKFRCIGSTTFEEYKKSFEKDRALSRRFSKIIIKEPSVAETTKILHGLKKYFEEHHKVKYTPAALKLAAELAAKHINDAQLPDKAIDVIDEAGAANAMLPAAKRQKSVTESQIIAVVSEIAGIPLTNKNARQETLRLKTLGKQIKQKVFGQDKAVQAVSQAILRSRAALQDERKPIGSFLFAGPTGVGKTELAKVLAAELDIGFTRFDMSEYMEKHTVARLVGAPPGYAGYDDGGQLTDLIRRQPYHLVLFDELEKAHQDIFNILLQVMDDATLTDSQGKKADFRNTILIMTTNAGSGQSSAFGFGQAAVSNRADTAIKNFFKPEFRNRLDEIVHFSPLSKETIIGIVDKFVAELTAKLGEKKVELSLTAAAKQYLAKHGFDEQLGARPMRRLIQQKIKDPLADQLLFGKLVKGGTVRFDYSKAKDDLIASFD